MDQKKKSQFSAGDSLVKNAPEHVRKLHEAHKKTVRAQQRNEFMSRQRAGNRADFGR